MVKDKIVADYIVSGKCKVSDKLPTVRELAKEYNVSYVTILEAVKILAQEGVVVKRQGSGIYISPKPAKSKDYPIVKRIGYITNSFAVKNAFGYKILEGIERVTCKSGYRLEVANSNGDFDREKQIVAAFIEGGIDGLVLYPADPRCSEYEYLASEFKDTPIVTVDLAQTSMQRSSVVFDNCNAGYEITKHLIAKGRRKLLFYYNSLDESNRAIQDRLSGIRKAIQQELANDSGIIFSVESWSGNSLKYSYDKLETIMNSSKRPDAIIASSDGQAASVYYWLISNGYKVPTGVELAGFDNILPDFVPWLEMGEGYHYHWPTTNPDFTRLGERAMELLLETIEGKNNIIREIVLPCPVLIQRHNANRKSFQKIPITEVR